MNSRLKNLIRQLGEAIHDSVSESEHIAGVVQDIRKQGFDVLLMLEATIGLNELEQQPTGLAGLDPQKALPAPQGEEALVEEAPFTSSDVTFLRSLRIAVREGSSEPAS